MDGRGGCCIARYAGGGGGAYDDATKMERAMLKFRPIAPKPVSAASGSVFGSSSSSSDNKASSGETTTYVKAGRGKRKYNANSITTKKRYNSGRKRVRQNNNKLQLQLQQQRDQRDEQSSGVTTLALLPESPSSTAGIKTPSSGSAPMWLSLNNNNNNASGAENNINYQNYFTNEKPEARSVVGGGVMVERVTNSWLTGEGLGRTDEERVRNLEWDTCPGFITEGYDNRVRWTNGAYKKMVFGEDVEVVAMKDEKVQVGNAAFTCRVKVQNTCTKDVKVLPCDVWRMDGGGFAWRLDVNAALSLGR